MFGLMFSWFLTLPLRKHTKAAYYCNTIRSDGMVFFIFNCLYHTTGCNIGKWSKWKKKLLLKKFLSSLQTLYRQCLQEHNKTSITISPLSVASSLNKSNESSDVVSSLHIHSECQQPWGMIPEAVFPNLWRIIYWTSQFLTWLIMPLMQSYLKAGDFTIKGKLKSALIENAIYYGSYLFICGILLIYIAAKGVSLDWQKLKAIASSASNTWGLFLLVLLLGKNF